MRAFVCMCVRVAVFSILITKIHLDHLKLLYFMTHVNGFCVEIYKTNLVAIDSYVNFDLQM